MGYIIKDIVFSNKKVTAIFDSGSMFTYMRKSSKPIDTICVSIEPIKARLAGETHELKEMCALEGEIDGYKFSFHAYIVDRIGKIFYDGETIELDLLIGAPVMEEWEIGIDMKTQEINLSGLKRRDFLSF